MPGAREAAPGRRAAAAQPLSCLRSTLQVLRARREDGRVREPLRAEVRFTRYGADCYAACMLACGHLDLGVEGGLDFPDIAALVPIVEAAGGVITDWRGGQAFDAGALVAAGDAGLHAQVLRLLAVAGTPQRSPRAPGASLFVDPEAERV